MELPNSTIFTYILSLTKSVRTHCFQKLFVKYHLPFKSDLTQGTLESHLAQGLHPSAKQNGDLTQGG